MKHLFILLSLSTFALKSLSSPSEESEINKKPILHVTIVRYGLLSLPSRGDWKLTKELDQTSIGKIKEQLFSKDRMDFRSQTLQHVCLSSLIKMRCPNEVDRVVVVATSSSLPEPYNSHLEGLVSSNKGLVEILRATPAENYKELIVDLIRKKASLGGYSWVVSSNLDDDDALPNNFLEALVEDKKHLIKGGVISYPQGVYLEITPELQAIYGGGYRFIKGFAGMTLWAPVESGNPLWKKPYIGLHGNHKKMGDNGKIKIVEIERPMMFIRSGHASNDQGDVRQKPEIGDVSRSSDRHLLYNWIVEIFGLELEKHPEYNKTTAAPGRHTINVFEK